VVREIVARVVTPIVRISNDGSSICVRSPSAQVFCSTTGRISRVPGGTGLDSLDAFLGRTCGLTAAGSAWCWGTEALPGDGRDSASAVPIAVAGGQVFAALTVGRSSACGRRADAALFCWGYNFFNQLTSAVSSKAATPVAVAAGQSFTSVSDGYDFMCGIAGGQAYCWGNNNYDQTGVAGNPGSCISDPCVGTPHLLIADSAFVSVATGNSHACALTASGQAWCWGYNGLGELGDSASTGCTFRAQCSTAPQAVKTTTRFRFLTIGNDHTCGLTQQGVAWCWGTNDRGQLGSGQPGLVARATPAPVAGNLVFSSIDARMETTCGITTDGKAYCWGQEIWDPMHRFRANQAPTALVLQP
jgi:alpha-tubulin suppressor-like RCC1 family protein